MEDLEDYRKMQRERFQKKKTEQSKTTEEPKAVSSAAATDSAVSSESWQRSSHEYFDEANLQSMQERESEELARKLQSEIDEDDYRRPDPQYSEALIDENPGEGWMHQFARPARSRERTERVPSIPRQDLEAAPIVIPDVMDMTAREGETDAEYAARLQESMYNGN
eukprot:GHVL01001291.1.p1 GENE.GHVL01001291.1~~GHVL01001291.1.p1  ORF type:complete len:166 (-),score=39.87 GHVL01001291.1:148-645(-)